MSTHWSELQRRSLVELGYELLRPIVPDAGRREAVPAGADHERLAKDVLRGAGLDPALIADVESWMQARNLPRLAQLRGDPAAKRAIWPRLRALRGARKPS